MSDELKTFTQWSVLGRRIHRGSKAKGFKDGEPLFDVHQTYEPTKKNWVATSARLGMPDPGEWEEMPH